MLPFDHAGRSLPTTRALARLIRQGGADALSEAVWHGAQARFQEIRCRSALNRVEGMPFRWTLNPYRGCTHACHYCFARRYQAHLELDADDEFSTVILVKMNVAEVLRRELARRSRPHELVALGTATDPYQPIEGRYRITRGCLRALAEARTPVGLVTKGPLVVRDIDVLTELGRGAGVTIYMSVPSVDDDVWRTLEPGTAPPLQRLRAVRQLREAGLDAGVLMAPIVPGVSSDPARLDRTIRAIAAHGAAFAGASLLHLEGATRDHFFRYLSREFPVLVPEYGRLYARKHAPPAYRDGVRRQVAALRTRYGLAGPASRPAADARGSGLETPPPRQATFDWPIEGVASPGAITRGREAPRSDPRSADGY